MILLFAPTVLCDVKINYVPTFIIHYVYNYCADNCCFIILYIFFSECRYEIDRKKQLLFCLSFLSDMIPLCNGYDFIKYFYVFIFAALLYPTD